MRFLKVTLRHQSRANLSPKTKLETTVSWKLMSVVNPISTGQISVHHQTIIKIYAFCRIRETDGVRLIWYGLRVLINASSSNLPKKISFSTGLRGASEWWWVIKRRLVAILLDWWVVMFAILTAMAWSIFSLLWSDLSVWFGFMLSAFGLILVFPLPCPRLRACCSAGREWPRLLQGVGDEVFS